MLCLIKGSVLAVRTFTPQGDSKKKAHILIGVAQTTGEKAEVIEVKDYNVHNRYSMGQIFDSLCQVQPWAMNGRSGITVTIHEGGFVDQADQTEKFLDEVE
jgi:hypothetical protein